MLANTLNTNEVKDRAGTEQEFQRLSTNGRSTEFGLITELPYLPHRLKVSHQETGTGAKRRRRSVVRFDKTIVGGDGLTTEPISAYVVLDSPVGIEADSNAMKDILANLMSFCASTGATTTILFDGTGNGAVTLITGGL